MHSFRLRIWIPAVILLLFTLLTGFALFYQYHLRYDNLLHAHSTAVRKTMISLQRSVEEALRHDDRHRIEREISALGITVEIRSVALSILGEPFWLRPVMPGNSSRGSRSCPVSVTRPCSRCWPCNSR